MMPVLGTGAEVAGYRIESLIGRGGMAVVYRAEDSRLGRKVALKLLAPELMQHEQFRQRFIRESRIAASIDHPNIIPIYEAGETDDALFIAMRYVAGKDLKALLAEQGPLDPARALNLFAQIGDALDAAHAHGLVHRDVKPGNVLIDRGHEGTDHAYLTDFGLTKRTSSLSGGLTGTGHFLGTIDYVAPEQIAAKPVEARTDIYALGCMLYECLTGQLPFHREDDAALLWAHLVEAPPPVTALRPDLSPEVDAVVARAMAKSAEQRYDSCHDLMVELRQSLHVPALMPAQRYETQQRHGGDQQGPATTSGTDHPSFPPGTFSGLPSPTAPPPEEEAASWPAEGAAADEASTYDEESYDQVSYDEAYDEELAYDDAAAYDADQRYDESTERADYAGEDAIVEEQQPAWQEQHEDRQGDEKAAGGRGRRWVVPVIAVAAVLALAGAALGFFLSTRKDSGLTGHFQAQKALPVSFDHPADWQAMVQGADGVFSPGGTAVAALFLDKGSPDSWSATSGLLRSSPSDVTGLYASLNSSLSQLDTTTTDGLAQLAALLPTNAQFSGAPQDVQVGGVPAKKLEGRVVNPAGGDELSLVTYVVQPRNAPDQGMQLTFFAPPDAIDADRALFSRIVDTVSFGG